MYFKSVRLRKCLVDEALAAFGDVDLTCFHCSYPRCIWAEQYGSTQLQILSTFLVPLQSLATGKFSPSDSDLRFEFEGHDRRNVWENSGNLFLFPLWSVRMSLLIYWNC